MKTEDAIAVGVENGAAALASKASYATGATTVALGLTIGDWAALIGIGATAVTFLANLWFRWRLDRRSQREHEARMVALPFQREMEQNRE